jgi:hypothetical protein
MLIIDLFSGKYFGLFAEIGKGFQFGLIWVAVFLISYLQYRFFEKPMTDLREKFAKQ